MVKTAIRTFSYRRISLKRYFNPPPLPRARTLRTLRKCGGVFGCGGGGGGNVAAKTSGLGGSGSSGSSGRLANGQRERGGSDDGGGRSGGDGPLATTHGSAAEVLYEGAKFDVDMGNAAEALETTAAAAARVRPPRPVDLGTMT